jgi:hypothetical protein
MGRQAMAGEQFLLSGDQLATFSGFSDSYPPPNFNAHLTYSGVAALGTSSDRFFLVRTSGTTETIANADIFNVYPAISDGMGGLMPGPTPLISGSAATPDAYGGAAAGDSYIALGMYSGGQVIVNLLGFGGATSFVGISEPPVGGGNSELELSEISAAEPGGVPCFVTGTLVTTDKGPIAVEDLVIGDLVWTLDHGFQPILALTRTLVVLNRFNQSQTPICIKKHAFGLGNPYRDVLVSPQHRMLLQGSDCEYLFGVGQVLCAAKFMTNMDSIVPVSGMITVEYMHFSFAQHQVVRTSGLFSESYFSGGNANLELASAKVTCRRVLQG